jgi:hypothetical protein
VFLFMLTVKDLSIVVALLAVATSAMAYLLLPGLLIRFYNSQDVRQTFEAKDASSYWIERLPVPVVVLAVLFIFYIFAMHVPLFYNGMFPLFGNWLTGMEGVLALDISIVSLAGLTWGVLGQMRWAWWAAVGYFGLLMFSSVMTLMGSTLSEMLSLMRLPPTELEMLKGVPLQGAHFAPFVGIPLAITLGVIILSKRHFGRQA